MLLFTLFFGGFFRGKFSGIGFEMYLYIAASESFGLVSLLGAMFPYKLLNMETVYYTKCLQKPLNLMLNTILVGPLLNALNAPLTNEIPIQTFFNSNLYSAQQQK